MNVIPKLNIHKTIIRGYGRVQVIEENNTRFVLFDNTLKDKLHTVLHIGQVHGEKLTLDEYKYLLYCR